MLLFFGVSVPSSFPRVAPGKEKRTGGTKGGKRKLAKQGEGEGTKGAGIRGGGGDGGKNSSSIVFLFFKKRKTLFFSFSCLGRARR